MTTKAELWIESDKKTLARWWCQFNRFKIPEDFPGPKPATPPGGNWFIMQQIEDKIGLKECLREWNKDQMPGDKFDAYFEKQAVRIEGEK